MSIKDIQTALGVASDGVWGYQSQTALDNNNLELTLDFNKVRSNFGRLTQPQVDGFNAILSAVNANKDAKTPLYLAYMLATAWHETAAEMQPIAEYGRGKGRKYGSYIDIDGKPYKNLPHLYYGRGYVQLTWLRNYALMRDLLGVDFVNKPELALEHDNAAKIMIIGMLDGLFTGKSLEDYIKYGTYTEFKNARRIINGTDKADLIAGYATKFLDCVILS